MPRRGGYVLASIVRAVVLFIVAVLVLFIILNLLEANFGNAFASVVAYLAALFDLGLSNLFVQFDPKVNIVLNYGLAAVLWLVISAIVTRLLARA